jgi:hypothetical protein
VADELNNRVLFIDSGNTAASRVYGQVSFSTKAGGCSPNNMAQPMDVALDGYNNLYGQQGFTVTVLI